MESEAEGLRLLALDGGGIRGLSELIILDEIMNRIKAEEGLEDVPKPCEYFDVIGGTSTGGLIAILLGRLCMSVEEAIKVYKKLAGKVFSEMKRMWQDGAFKASLFEAAVKDIVARYDESGDENARMMSDVSKWRECKTFVCATPALNISHPRLFRSYEARSNQAYNPTIWEAARATCAAPTVFKRIYLGVDPKEEFIDGGLRCHNPTAEVFREAQTLWGMDHPISCIVSIGTGHPRAITLRKPDRFQRLLPTDFIGVLLGISTDCEALSEDFERMYGDGNAKTVKTYFRLNVQHGLEDVSLAEWTRMSEVKTHTLQYLRAAAVGMKINRLTNVLRVKKRMQEKESDRDLGNSTQLVYDPSHSLLSSSNSSPTSWNPFTHHDPRLESSYTSVETSPSISQSQVMLVEKREKVTASLSVIFHNVTLYKHLLSCCEGDAQKVLDAFQTLLDTESFQDRVHLIAVMRRLSERTNLYPTRFSLKGPSPSFADEPVAAGGFADIYRIVFQGEETCFKTIRVYQRSQVEHMAKVYAREAIVWAQLSHQNILPFYGLAQLGSRLSFVSRWATNGNLEDYLTHKPDANRLLLCSDTAAGVEYLHKNDIVHGDLKGQNVLIDRSGRAALGDFGLASVTDSQILKWTSQSTMASNGGTIRWQAPELLPSEDTSEQVHNSKASDVFAWANVCYEIFTGRLPFYEILNTTSVMLSVMRGHTPTRPQDDDPAWSEHGLNDRIWDLMKDCWNLQPSERPDMPTVIARLDTEKPFDSRPRGEWVEKVAMRFRNAQDGETPKDNMPSFWEEINSLLSRIVPGI